MWEWDITHLLLHFLYGTYWLWDQNFLINYEPVEITFEKRHFSFVSRLLYRSRCVDFVREQGQVE